MRIRAVATLAALLAGPIAMADGPSRDDLWKEVSERRARLQVAEDQLLAPDPRDVEAFAGLLAQPDTGLVRLLPNERGERVLAIRGGGAYYSFARRTQEQGHGSDIMLERGTLISGLAGADFGFFEEVEELPLETMTSEHQRASSLVGFKIPDTLQGARAVQARSRPDSTTGRPPLLRQVGVVRGRTYILRSVVYHSTDVLVAFRVVREDDDGSVTLLWKILERFPTPDLKD